MSTTAKGTTSAIHQFVATAEPGAVGTHLRELQRLVRTEMGLRSEIFAEHRRGPFADDAHAYRDYGGPIPAGPDDVVIYHLAIGSVVADWLMQRPQTLVVIHHNLTPVPFLRGWDPDATYGVDWGLRQLPQLARRARLGIGDSSFNEVDLIRAGFAHTEVAPVLFNTGSLDHLGLHTGAEDAPSDTAPSDTAPAEGVAGEAASRRGASWLFVGRLAANKAQHQIIRALAAYRRLYDPDAVVRLVGGPTKGPYVDALGRYRDALGLGGAVTLTGPVSDTRLASEYRRSDILVCLSEHEGFCVPLVEAMSQRVPIVALGSSAIPETVGDAGLVLPFRRDRQPSALTVAAAVHRVLSDPDLGHALVEAGSRRAAELSLPGSSERWLRILGDLVGAETAP